MMRKDPIFITPCDSIHTPKDKIIPYGNWPGGYYDPERLKSTIKRMWGIEDNQESKENKVYKKTK